MERPSGRLTDEDAEVLQCDGSDPHCAGLGVVGQSFSARYRTVEGVGGMRHEPRAGVSRPSGERLTDPQCYVSGPQYRRCMSCMMRATMPSVTVDINFMLLQVSLSTTVELVVN